MNTIDKLTEIFKDFPGIGPRQAKRFVYFLLGQNDKYIEETSNLLKELKNDIGLCEKCFRFYIKNSNNIKICNICSNNFRENSLLMIVSRDVDFENIEKTKNYNGNYFILGGTIPILEKNPERKIRQKELMEILSERINNGLKEIIIALDYNPEGENTIEYIKNLLKPICEKNNIKLSTLGKGLSTGTELEYSDKDTLKSALENRR